MKRRRTAEATAEAAVGPSVGVPFEDISPSATKLAKTDHRGGKRSEGALYDKYVTVALSTVAPLGQPYWIKFQNIVST